VDPVALQGRAVLGPGESRNGISLDRGRDPQLLALVDGHVAHRPGEGRGGPVDALLGPGLDGDGGVRPTTIVVTEAVRRSPYFYKS